MNTTTRDYPATERTVKYIQDLLDERDLEASAKFREDTASMDAEEVSLYIVRLRQKPRTMTQETASAWIDRLKELPRKTEAVAGRSDSQGGKDFKALAAQVPAGRYAITGQDGTTDFYRIDKPTEGKWSGYTFGKLQLSDDYQRIPFKNLYSVLERIVADGPEEASKRYGRELGHCGVCGRTLTNPESIERGIGPVCAGKNEWVF